MNPRPPPRMPASIGSNQASPANSAGPSACVLVLSCSMAWSPPALERRKWLVEQARDYATNPFPPHPRRHRMFCAGRQIDNLLALQQAGMDAIHRAYHRLRELNEAIYYCPKPVVAALDLYALGAG